MKQTGWHTIQEMVPCLWVTGRGCRSDDRGIRAEVSQPRAGGERGNEMPGKLERAQNSQENQGNRG